MSVLSLMQAWNVTKICLVTAYALGGLKKQYYVDRAPRMVIWLENNHLLPAAAGKEICVRGYCRHEGTGILSESLRPKQILEGKRMVDWTHCFEIVSKSPDVPRTLLRAKNKREFVKWTTCLSQKDTVDSWKPMSGYLWTKPAEKRWFFELKRDKISMSKQPGGRVVRQWTDLNSTRLLSHEKGIVLNKHNGWQATVTFKFPSTVSNSLIKGWQRIYLTAQPEVTDGESVL